MLGCVSHAVRGSSPASVTYEQVFGQRPEGVDDMRVLGIDPGLTRCGMGVVEGDVGRPLRLVDVNVLRTSSDEHVSMRLVHLERGIEAWLDEHRPEAVAIERVFARSDSSTIMGTAQASGIAMVAAARRGLPIALHTPSEVKAAVTGSGRADKAQVGAMVTRILRLEAPPKPADAADALALAITHIWRGGAQARIDAALAAAGRRHS
jgi:crossover junction endodeoxyribonuclease RuvC